MGGLSASTARSRVPPQTRAHIPIFAMNQLHTHSPKSRASAPRRASHSHIRPKQTVELRRVKKQMAERARRARISDKIVQLHGLALSIIGQDVERRVRMEKVEMLNFCHEVLSDLHNLLEESPEVKARLQARLQPRHSGCCGAAHTARRRHLTSTSVPPSATTASISAPHSTPCDSGVFESPASTSTSVLQSPSVVNSSLDATDCCAPPKERKAIWRPYLHCL